MHLYLRIGYGYSWSAPTLHNNNIMSARLPLLPSNWAIPTCHHPSKIASWSVSSLPPSLPPSLPAALYLCLSLLWHLTCPDTVPSSPPTNFVIQPTPWSLHLSWDPPPPEDRNGLITNYTIQVSRPGIPQREEMNMNGTVREFSMSGLSPYTL